MDGSKKDAKKQTSATTDKGNEIFIQRKPSSGVMQDRCTQDVHHIKDITRDIFLCSFFYSILHSILHSISLFAAILLR